MFSELSLRLEVLSVRVRERLGASRELDPTDAAEAEVKCLWLPPLCLRWLVIPFCFVGDVDVGVCICVAWAI